jgi:hypothetical protein
MSEPLTIKQLAVRAGMAEQTVRNKLSTAPHTMPPRLSPVGRPLFDSDDVLDWINSHRPGADPVVKHRGRPSIMRRTGEALDKHYNHYFSNHIFENINQERLTYFHDLFVQGIDPELDKILDNLVQWASPASAGYRPFPLDVRNQLMTLAASKSGLSVEQLAVYDAMSDTIGALLEHLITRVEMTHVASEPLPEELTL